MNDEKAIQMLSQIFDQCTGSGMFKTLETAHQVQELLTYVKGRLQWPAAANLDITHGA
jgi:hypothetical protein